MLPWYPSLHFRKATKLSLLAIFHTWLSSLAPHIWKENRHLIIYAEKTWKCHRWHLLSRPNPGIAAQLSVCQAVYISTRPSLQGSSSMYWSSFHLLVLLASTLPLFRSASYSTVTQTHSIQIVTYHPCTKKLYWVTLIHRIWPKPPTRL